jgi:hypothetical protein
LMKVVGQILFLLFYVASAYAVRAERIADTIQEVRAAAVTESLEIGSDETHSPHGFPRYREAKKVNKDFENRPALIVTLAPESAFHDFTVSPTSIRSLSTLDSSHPRAPPILS